MLPMNIRFERACRNPVPVPHVRLLWCPRPDLKWTCLHPCRMPFDLARTAWLFGRRDKICHARLRRRREDKTSHASAEGGPFALRTVLTRLVKSIPKRKRKAVANDLESFIHLFERYQSENHAQPEIDWDKVSVPRSEQIVQYKDLNDAEDVQPLHRLAVLKVNGGLGTSMELSGAKGALEVQNKLSFIDLAIRQIQTLNATEGVDIPLLFMTSFNTEEDTNRIIRKYAKGPTKISTFSQSRYPRLDVESLLPIAKPRQDDRQTRYPPGHGDLYNALVRSGTLDRLLAEGKEYLFVPNSDNLGATVDRRILRHMIETQTEFIMQITEKTKADIKGGTLVDYEGTLRLLELAQVPTQHVEEFTSAKNFKIFNTNNLWINLPALRRTMEQAAGWSTA
ncbi:UTP-glucose-1-phosphate uridylyltransferase [Coprinopsis cinerea AmutBmut pab1-1]|nr:UTP-glucose-1-phosphate uridylyltransferase [Coprinopsis cinerea AmutBmut pab1-1]